MSDKDNKKPRSLPLPLHEVLPDMITDAAIKGDVGGFLRLLKIIEQVKIPDNHAVILEAVRRGWEIIKDGLECDFTMAEGTLEMEIYRRDTAQDKQDEADYSAMVSAKEEENVNGDGSPQILSTFIGETNTKPATTPRCGEANQ